jgi:hypothetical protein
MNLIKFAFMVLCLGMISCAQMNEDAGMVGLADTEMPAGEETGFVHTVRKDGVEFRLSLLNEQGEPANVFREGENFSLHFEMENLKEGDGRQYFAQLFGDMYVGAGLGEVFSSAGERVANFFTEGEACLKILASYPFDKKNRLAVTFPWKDSQNGEWAMYLLCNFKGNPSYVLPKGAYSTGFTHTFEYRIPPVWDGKDINAIPPETWVEVGPVTMRIDFTVE